MADITLKASVTTNHYFFTEPNGIVREIQYKANTSLKYLKKLETHNVFQKNVTFLHHARRKLL